MRRFTEQWPQIEVMLDELEDEEIVGAVERGELDVGFVLLPVGDAPLETIELLRDPYVLIVAAGSPLAGDARRRCARSPPSRSSDSATSHAVAQIEAAFRAEGIEPHWAFRSNDNPTVQGLVARRRRHRRHAAADRRRDRPADRRRRARQRRRRRGSSRSRGTATATARRPRGRSWRRARERRYSTVTVFARFRGWSTFRPRRRAMR